MNNKKAESLERRGFLKTAAFAGAASLASSGYANAASDPNRRLRVGAMGVKDSFTSYGWSDIIDPEKPANSEKRGTFDTQLLNMDITHVWDVDFEAAKKYADRLGATAVKDYDGMVGKVDGIIFGGMNEVPWYKYLARPYLEAGIPMYLSRPFAYCMRDIDEILELAAKHNTPILCTAKDEHFHEVPALKSKLKDLGVIKLVHATGNANDFPMHFHIMFMMMQILGYDIKEASVITDGNKGNSYCQVTFLYNEWDGQPDFLCSIHGVYNREQFTINMFGERYTVTTNMVRSPEWRDRLLFQFAPLLIAIQRTFYGELFEPMDNIRKKTEIWLTAYYSHLERGGAPVEVGSLSPDWRAPYPVPDLIDESMFNK